MQLSPEEELEVRSCLAAIETEERKKELKKKEKELKEKEEKLVQKATEIRNAHYRANQHNSRESPFHRRRCQSS